MNVSIPVFFCVYVYMCICVCVCVCVCVVVVVVAGLDQPVPTANSPGLQEGPEILSHPFQRDWGLFFI